MPTYARLLRDAGITDGLNNIIFADGGQKFNRKDCKSVPRYVILYSSGIVLCDIKLGFKQFISMKNLTGIRYSVMNHTLILKDSLIFIAPLLSLLLVAARIKTRLLHYT